MATLQKGVDLKKNNISLWIPSQQLFTAKCPWSEEALKSLVLLLGLFWTEPSHSTGSWVWAGTCAVCQMWAGQFPRCCKTLFWGGGNKKMDLSFRGRTIPVTSITFYYCTGIVLPQSLLLQWHLLFLQVFPEEKISHFLSVSYFLKCLPSFFAFSRLQHIFVW